ncbi:MAG: hypothetical protein GY778_29780 [bacterium]|nr:hypothetical protein [bacterium]
MAGQPWIHRLPPTCPNCGYNLTGLTSPRCPECGVVFRQKEVEQRARELSVETVRLRGVNDVPWFGFKVAVIGYVVVGCGFLIDLSAFTRIVGVVAGVVAIGLGLSVFRALRVPAHLREDLPSQPNYMLGVGVAVMGLMLAAVAIVLP